MAGFEYYSNGTEFKQAREKRSLPECYVVRNYPHPTLWGTRGFREGYINDNGVEYLIEAKYQDSEGTVFEKIPLVLDAMLNSHIKNHIIVFGGKWWRDNPVGLAVIAWLRRQLTDKCDRNRRPVPLGYKIWVFENEDELTDFFKEKWGNNVTKKQQQLALSNWVK
jgi:hypothetical protein